MRGRIRRLWATLRNCPSCSFMPWRRILGEHNFLILHPTWTKDDPSEKKWDLEFWASLSVFASASLSLNTGRDWGTSADGKWRSVLEEGLLTLSLNSTHTNCSDLKRPAKLAIRVTGIKLQSSRIWTKTFASPVTGVHTTLFFCADAMTGLSYFHVAANWGHLPHEAQ